METVLETVKHMRKQTHEIQSLPIHYQVETFVNCWNWLTCPSRPMTDKEHSICKRLAKRLYKALKSMPYWSESDSGMLWYDGQRIPLSKQCKY